MPLRFVNLFLIPLFVGFLLAGCAQDYETAYLQRMQHRREQLNYLGWNWSMKCEMLAKQWSEEIEKRGGDKVTWEDIDIRALQDEVGRHYALTMGDLANPPPSLAKARELMVQQYAVMRQMVVLAESPDHFDSLDAYWDKYTEVKKEYDALKAQVDRQLAPLSRG